MPQWLTRLVLAVLVAAPAAVLAAEPTLPPNVEFVTRKDPVSEYRLRSNGMPILLVERHAAPVVTFMVVYHVGSRNEAPGNTGSAHLLEHMLFNKSTEHFGKAGGHKTIQVALHEAGVDFSSTNMTTWNDRMNGFSTVPSDKLDLAMQIEADRIQTAKILDSERQPEMSVVRNEYEIGENRPEQALSKAVTSAAIVAHPYHWDTIGFRSDIEGVSTEQLREHYRNFFWPDNAEAIVVGDFEPGAALAMFDRYFGAMPKAPKPIPKVITVEPAQEGERRVIVSRPGNVGWLEFAWLRPGTLDPDWHALDVLANILGSGRTSRMYKALVETGQAGDVSVNNESFRDPYLFAPFVQLAPGATHAAAESTLRAVVDTLCASGVTQVEVDRAVRGIEVGLASGRDGVFGMASALGEAVASANWQWAVDYLDNVKKVTPADVQRVARRYLVPDHLTVGWFVPKKSGHPGKVGAIPPAEEPKLAAAPAAGTPGPLGVLLLPVTAGEVAPAARPSFASRTVHKEWPGRLILDVFPNSAAPTVAISANLRAGTIYAPAGRPFVAGITADLLSCGTTRRTKDQISSTLEDLGASMGFNANVYDLDISAYGLSRDLPTILDLLADQLLHPTFPAEELEKAKLQRKAALLAAAENTAQRAQEVLYQAEFPEGHPVRPIRLLDRAQAVGTVTLDEVKAFYAKHYAGGTLALAVAGDVNADSVIGAVGRLFADMPAGTPPQLDAPRGMPGAPTRQVVTMKGKANMDLLYGMAGGLRRTDPDYYPCLVANAVFGQDALTSRAGKRVRDTEGLTYNLYSRWFGTDLLDGVWGVDVAVAPQNLRKALASTLDEFQKFAAGGITAEELEAQKGFFAGNFKVRLATNTGVAQQLAFAEKFGYGPGYLDAYPRDIEAVTLQQVNEAIRKHFDPTKLSLVVAGDLEALPAP